MAIILTLEIVVGIALLFYGGFFLKKQEDEHDLPNHETVNMLKQSVEEADTTLSNINSVSSLIIEEIDIKYKELLFLYQMMEEKKKEILEHETIIADEPEDNTLEPISVPSIDAVYEANLDILEIGMKMDKIKEFPKLNNKEAILEMHENGYDITDIARELGIGKGEVKLVIGLNKVGVGSE